MQGDHSRILGPLPFGLFVAVAALLFAVLIFLASISFRVDELSRTLGVLAQSAGAAATKQTACSPVMQGDGGEISALAQAITEKNTTLDRLAGQLAQCRCCQAAPERRVDSARRGAVGGAPDQREADDPSDPVTRHLGDPMSPLKWRDNAAPEDVERVDFVLARHAEQARRRMATETDPKNPDASVVRRIMDETRESISSELGDLWETSGPPTSR